MNDEQGARLLDSARAFAEWIQKRPLRRYLFGLAMVAIAFLLRLGMAPLTGEGAPFVLFFGATLVTSLVAGAGPGVGVVAITLPLAAYMFVVRAGYSVAQASFQGMLYAIDGLLIIYLTSRVNKTRRVVESVNRELRAANEQITEVASHTRELIELAPDAFFLADLDARFIDVNDAACKMLGYERDELLGKTIFDIIPVKDAARLERVKTELLVPGRAERAEWVHIRKDGTTVPVEVSANMLPGGRWQAFVRDITPRKQLEDERQVFMSLLDNSSDFIGIADPAGKPIYVNPAGRRMVGLPLDYPVEKTEIPEYYPPDERSFANDVILKSMLEHGRWSGETRFRNWETEEPIPVSDEHFMVRDASGTRILGMATITRDISETKLIYDQLRESEERFRLALDEAPIGMALVALDGRFVRVNRALCDIVGYDAAELTGLTFQAITHPDDIATDMAFADQLARGEIQRCQFAKRYRHKNGTTVEVMLHVSILRARDGAPLYYVVQVEDVTERNRAEAEQQRREREIQRAVQMRDQVLGVVAHDLRNPLNTIVLLVSTLQQRGLELEKRGPERLERIARAADRMDRLIQDLLDVALLEEGKLTLTRAPLAITDVVREAVEMQRALATAADLDVQLDIEGDVPEVWVDHHRLLQVLENLIGNAMKFTRAGGRITVGAASRERDVLFWVADTGAGIAPENIPHVFDRFWQATATTRRLGAGLGLSITKGIIEAHGGRIWVDSVSGKGSTFFFSIPRGCPKEERMSSFVH